MSIIIPTVGRKVWFHPQEEDIAEGVDYRDQPLDATVVYVHGSSLVNLHVIDASGNAWKFENVLLLQEERPIGFPVRCAEWMPYQKQQASRYPTAADPVWKSPV
jgi:hypothetical protein